MIQGLLVSREILYKWKRVDSVYCPLCKEKENVKHIYYDCKRIQELWKMLGQLIDVKIQWKHIVFGFTQDLVIHKFRNLLMKIILYAIFKTWLQGIDDSPKFVVYKSVWKNILNDLKLWNSILQITATGKQHRVFRSMWNCFFNKIES